MVTGYKIKWVKWILGKLNNTKITWKEIEALAFEVERKYLKSVNLFDIYTDEKMAPKKSYAVSFILQDEEKTLTDKEIDNIMDRLINAFKKKVGAVLR